MMKSSLVHCCLLLSLFLLGPGEGLHIASFNIEIFGVTKFDNQEVVNILAQVRSGPAAERHCCGAANEQQGLLFYLWSVLNQACPSFRNEPFTFVFIVQC